MTIVFKNDKERPEKREKAILSPKEAAKYLNLHQVTLYRLIKKKELPFFRIGGQWRVKRDLLERWIRGQTEK